MRRVLGWDIGGANTKAAYIQTDNATVIDCKIALEYFPFWKRDTTQLCSMLTQVKQKLCGTDPIDLITVTITAELSDAYTTKREGIHHILNCLQQVFPQTTIQILTTDASLRSVEQAKAHPVEVAAANWAATGWMIAQHIKNCVIVDIGSTSTSIIPVLNAEVAAKGKTDLEKLMNGELVYTGSLRTNVAAIVQSVPVKGGVARVSSELFAQSGDVHIVLGNIQSSEYTAETADAKPKTLPCSLARLARVVCADSDMLTKHEIQQIATYIYEQQIRQITQGLNQVYAQLPDNAKTAIPTIVTGLGKDFLARKAAQNAGIHKVLALDEVLHPTAVLASPAVGVALMGATKLKGAKLQWMR
ncbi:MAG: H4MPT-linked C1 transfer pathway protein [Candidatus Bathyarchaeota archaeon]|nr:H4MPT-linked C1 transfer pathway protein [Candidatus Bathyarchaeota archaeon]